MKRPPSRRVLDSWFPTVCRYCGLVLFAYAGIVDRGRNPALIPAATGLIFLKTALNGGGE